MSTNRNKLIIKYITPTILSGVSYFLFTIVDAIFLGHGVGTDALGAINLSMPYVNILNALFMITTIGGATIAAVHLGREDADKANSVFMHAVSGTVVIAAVLSFVGVFLTDPLAKLLGANATFHGMVTEYLFWYSVFIIPSGLGIVLQGFVRNDGNPGLAGVSVIVGTLLNIFGDWLFIFPLQMGLKGAALATGISQTIGMLIVISHFLRKKGQLSFRPFRFAGKQMGEVLVRGLPETISQFGNPITITCMNHILLAQIGDIAVNAFSVINYVASFSMALFYGVSEGLQPLFGVNYGSKNESDLKYYLRSGLKINFFGSILIVLVVSFFSAPVCALFGADAATVEFTVANMGKYAWGFIFMALNVLISSYFYSTMHTKEALIINVLHSFVINTSIIVLLPMAFGVGIVWFTFGIYEILVLLVSAVLLRRSMRQKLT